MVAIFKILTMFWKQGGFQLELFLKLCQIDFDFFFNEKFICKHSGTLHLSNAWLFIDNWLHKQIKHIENCLFWFKFSMFIHKWIWIIKLSSFGGVQKTLENTFYLQDTCILRQSLCRIGMLFNNFYILNARKQSFQLILSTIRYVARVLLTKQLFFSLNVCACLSNWSKACCL